MYIATMDTVPPWRKEYWLGAVDARPLALFRIFFGMVLLQDLARRAESLLVFLGDEGMLPRGAQQERWAWTLFDLVGGPSGVWALFALCVLSTLLFTVGCKTRITTALTWFLTLCIQNRNLSIGDGGDDLSRVLLFWAIFTDLGGAYSVDAWLRKGRRFAPAFGARLLTWQFALVYAAAGYFKVRGSWLGGQVIFQTMQLDGFVRPPGLSLAAFPTLCRLLTWGALAMEIVLPVLMLSWKHVARARALAILLGAGLQVGLYATMRVGIFTGVMIGSSLLFVLPEWLDRFWPQRETPSPPGFPTGNRAGTLVAGVVLLQFCLTGLIMLRPWSWLDTELKWTGFNEGLDLFSNPADIRRWRAPAVLADGSNVDLLPIVVPELQPKPAYMFNRWTKFTFKNEHRYDKLADYMCRRYAEQVPAGPRLVSFQLVRDMQRPRLPNESDTPVRTEILWSQAACP